MKQVVLITDRFPYSSGEEFIEPELLYFGSIKYIISKTNQDTTKRELPKGIKHYNLPKTPRSLAFIFALTRLEFWTELIELIKTKRMNKSVFSQLYNFVGRPIMDVRAITNYLMNEGVKKTDNLVFYSYWCLTQAYRAVLLKKSFMNATAVSRTHGGDLFEDRRKNHYLPLRRYIFNHLDALYPCSLYGVHYIQKQYKYQPKILAVKRLGTNDYGYKIINNERNFRIISCSDIIPLKRVKLIVLALSMLSFTYEWFHFGDGVLRGEVESLASQKNVNYNFKGMVLHDELITWYRTNDCHLFINVSESEGVPVSIMEALSFAIPVIASDVGGSGEIVKNGYNGLLLEKDFVPEQLAEMITMFYHMEEKEYRVYQQAARDIWDKYCAAHKVYPAYEREVLSLERT
ncbi:MAG: glycosyltransferase [Lachnospiraceae bacterium]|jgi:glycosyltransferase involved in cell wall biosynthesis|nr:glycosyltransferase [Lachnospiraceae bacterium]